VNGLDIHTFRVDRGTRALTAAVHAMGTSPAERLLRDVHYRLSLRFGHPHLGECSVVGRGPVG
jgi:hypothetical protein